MNKETSKELFSKLSLCSRCLDDLVVEMEHIPHYDPYDPYDWNGGTRTSNDVELDINYNLWETQRVVKELCERFNVKVS